MKSNFARKGQRKFRRRLYGVQVLHRNIIQNLVNRVRTVCMLIAGKPRHEDQVLTEEELDGVGARLKRSRLDDIEVLV
jgi:hypothetical protein